MKSAFLQVEVDLESRDFRAFSVPGRGQFRFKRMSFGLTNSPSTFQEMIDIGAVLTQEMDREQHPIIFINRLLSSAERKYTTTEK